MMGMDPQICERYTVFSLRSGYAFANESSNFIFGAGELDASAFLNHIREPDRKNCGTSHSSCQRSGAVEKTQCCRTRRYHPPDLARFKSVTALASIIFGLRTNGVRPIHVQYLLSLPSKKCSIGGGSLVFERPDPVLTQNVSLYSTKTIVHPTKRFYLRYLPPCVPNELSLINRIHRGRSQRVLGCTRIAYFVNDLNTSFIYCGD